MSFHELLELYHIFALLQKKKKSQIKTKIKDSTTGAEKWREFRRRFRRLNRNLKNQRMVLRDHEQVEVMILIHSALSDDKHTVVNSVEAELTNMDLKAISARSLPDPHTLQKSSHLLGSKVLQVNHTSLYFSLIFLVFCLVAEKIDEGKEKCGLSFARNSSSGRLLKLGLTEASFLELRQTVWGKGEARGRARWEKRKAGAKPSIGGACTGSSREEELARQVQNEFDLDDYHVSVSAYSDH
ncbi:unnamed protein product [Malus baccata var. baccata]